MAKNWENGEMVGADLLGFGCFQFIHGGSGKSKAKTQIGFVRQDANCKTRPSKATKNVHRKGGVSNKGRSQKSQARRK